MTDKKVDKLVFFLPNTCTALNIACGFLSVIYSFQGKFYEACIFIAIGAFLDSIDGRLARLVGAESQFGEQFDSLSDLISFGMAPSMIFYFRFLTDFNRLGMVVAFMFLLCGALRLARFNANIDKVSSDYFQGLPIPGAATALIGYVLLSLEFGHLTILEVIAVPYILLYSLLMISNIPFPSFKKSDWVRRNKRKVLFILILLFAAVFVWTEGMVFTIISVYVFGSLIYMFTHKNKMKDIFSWDENANANQPHKD
ncbi:MAG: CDP-diacylglycerol--serine O-phosphatidyltransferase [Halobacteriovoraceae bacterium]|nr:CDP-diacylglycerol--serine O-phosphatidyltransferase [Halobacteriovoraceae bacterium]